VAEPTPDPRTVYRSQPGVGWVMTDQGIRWVDARGGGGQWPYPQAAAWALVVSGRGFGAIVPLLAAVMAADEAAAAEALGAWLEDWLAAGLLAAEGGGG